MVMTIENYSGTADKFTWPYNPISFDDPTNSNHTLTRMGYQRHHIVVSGGGMDPKNIILTGHFSGASKLTHWRSCSKHFCETTKLKKLNFESDKFHLGIGKQIKRTQSGGRTNFIDYVATFEAVVGILFSTTEKSSGTNEGNATTYVTEITGTVTDGSSDITIKDDLGNEITIPAASLTTGQSVLYKFINMVDSGSGIYVSEYSYVEINDAQIKTVQTTDGFGILKIAPAANITTITTSNISSAVVKTRDGYYD